jgi:hypothetical protein
MEMNVAAHLEPVNLTVELPHEVSALVLSFRRPHEPLELAARGIAEYDSWSAGAAEYQSWAALFSADVRAGG